MAQSSSIPTLPKIDRDGGRQLALVRLEPRPHVTGRGTSRVHQATAGDRERNKTRRPLTRDEIDVAIKYLKAADPLYYNSLVDKNISKHFKKRAVRQHLMQHGYMAKDGTIFLTQQERIAANAGNRLERSCQEALRKVQDRERERLRRLRLAYKNGDIAMNTLGDYVETKPCSLCMVSHPVTLHLMDFSPCPGSVQNKYFHHPPVTQPAQSKPVPRPKVRGSEVCSVGCILCVHVATVCVYNSGKGISSPDHENVRSYLSVLLDR